MRFLTAPLIYPVNSQPVANGIIAIHDSGEIVEVIDPSKAEFNSATEKYDGILCPGFINAHCHLELSHMKGRITEKGKLAGFISEIVSKRNDTQEHIFE